jgi:antitoxin component of MazEF toxin-antitoxin module
MDEQEEPKNIITILNNGKETDITPQEIEIVNKFKDEGLPGIAQVTTIQITKALDLYLSGKTYFEISKTLNIKKESILYLASKFDWYSTKIEQLKIIDANMKERILHAKLINSDFLLQMQQFFQTKIGRKMTRYMATGDEDIADELKTKDIEYYFRAVDLLDKLTEPKNNNKKAAIGFNLGDQEVSVRKVGENEVVISPKQKTTGEMLAEIANMKRQEEKTYDINKKESEKKEENK